MKNSGSYGEKSARRRALAVAAAAVIAAVVGAGLSGPARGEVVRSAVVAADRAYPVLADTGGTVSGTGTLTEIGPTWEVSFKLKDPGQIVIDPNGKFAYVITANGIAVISGVNTAHPKVTATVRTGSGAAAGIALNQAGTELTVSANSTEQGPMLVTYTGAATGKLKPERFLVDEEPTWQTPGPLAVTPDGTYSYVGSGTGQFSQVSWIGQNPVNRNIYFGQWDRADTVTPNGQYAYLLSIFDPSVTTARAMLGVVKNADSAKPALFKTFILPQNEAVGYNLAVAPNGKYAYLPYGGAYVFRGNGEVSTGAGKLLVITGAQTTPKEARSLALPSSADEIAFAPGGTYAFATTDGTTGRAGAIFVLTGTGTGQPRIAATWKLPFLPADIAVSPAR